MRPETRRGALRFTFVGEEGAGGGAFAVMGGRTRVERRGAGGRKEVRGDGEREGRVEGREDCACVGVGCEGVGGSSLSLVIRLR